MNRLYFTFILTLFCAFSHAQFEHATWYFGEKAGISFSSGSPVGITDGEINTGEGCASISDECGNILFYTDGGRVYNRNHTVMQNGYGLAGNSTSTQSAIIVPNPANANQYYIFTIYSVSGFFRSLVDMTLDGGNGGLVAGQKNIQIPILSGQYKASEKLTVALTKDCNGFWIITQAVDKFYSYKLTEGGFNATPVISTIGLSVPLVAAASSIGYLKASPDSKKLAIAHRRVTGTSAEFGALAIYDFDNATGAVSNENVLHAPDLTALPRQYYGVEFSPNAQVLYASTETNLYQYNLASSNIPSTEKSISGGLIGAMQLGIDRKIYLSPFESYYLSVINDPNELLDPTAGTNPDFVYNGVYLEGKKSKFGVPSYIIPYDYKGKIEINTVNIKCEGNNCFQVPLSFKFLGCSTASLVWDFGDGSTSTAANPVHTYASVGTYTILLTYTLQGHTYTTTTKITIHPLPNAQDAELKKCPNLNGSNVTFDLTDSYPLINPTGETVTYSFHLTAQEARDKQDPQPLTYPTNSNATLWVRVENLQGCFSVVQLDLLLYKTPIYTIVVPKACTNSSALLEVNTDPANTVSWFDSQTAVAPISTGISFTTPVLTATTSYWVEVSNGFCPAERHEIIVDVVAKPSIVIQPYSNLCEGESVTLTAVSAGNTINWYLSNPGVLHFTGDSFATGNLTATTSFWVEAENLLTGCKSDKTEVIVVVNALRTPAFTQPPPICTGGLLSALPAISLESITGSWSPALDNTQTTTYTFTPDAGQCAIAQTMVITVNPSVTPTFNAVLPICAGEALAPLSGISIEGITGSWSPALDNTQTTTYTFSPDTGQCAIAQTLVIAVNQSVTPTFNAVSPICTGESLAALPTISLEGITGTWLPALDNTQTTTYTFTPNLGECASQQTLIISVNPLVTPTFNPVAPICRGGSLQPLPTISLEGITGSWSPLPDNTQTTTYTFTPDTGQCATGLVLMNIVVNTLITPVFSIATTYCQNAIPDALPVLSSNGISGTWFPSIIDTSVAGTHTYEFSPDTAQCTTGKITLTVNVSGAGRPAFNINSAYCQNATPDNLPTVSDNGIPGSWSPSAIDTSVLGIKNYTFTSVPGSCSVTYQFELVVEVTRITIPVFDLITDYYFVETPQILPTVSDNGISGNWYPSVVLPNTLATGTYMFVPDTDQCADVFSIEMNVVNYPNYFTPNSDGYNDSWNINALQGQSDALISIYDRYGKMLKTIGTQGAGWDGTYNGKQMPSDDYWFVLTYRNKEGLQKQFRAHFTLKR